MLLHILHCPLSGPDLIYISLLIIFCIIEYVTNKTLNWILNPLMMGVKNRTEVCLLLLIYVVFWYKNLDSIISGPQRTVQGQYMTPLIKVYHFCIKKVLNCSIDHKYWIYLEGLVCVSHVSMGWMKRNRKALFIRNKPICEWLARWPVTRLCSITSVRINLWSVWAQLQHPQRALEIIIRWWTPEETYLCSPGHHREITALLQHLGLWQRDLIGFCGHLLHCKTKPHISPHTLTD